MTSAVVLSRTPTTRRLPKAEIARLAAGFLVVAGTLFGQQIFGFMTRSTRIDPAIPGTGLVDVVAALDFDPERFHNDRLATYGMFSGRDGSVRRIRLRQVSQDSLQRLASLPWVARLEPLK